MMSMIRDRILQTTATAAVFVGKICFFHIPRKPAKQRRSFIIREEERRCLAGLAEVAKNSEIRKKSRNQFFFAFFLVFDFFTFASKPSKQRPSIFHQRSSNDFTRFPRLIALAAWSCGGCVMPASCELEPDWLLEQLGQANAKVRGERKAIRRELKTGVLLFPHIQILVCDDYNVEEAVEILNTSGTLKHVVVVGSEGKAQGCIPIK